MGKSTGIRAEQYVFRKLSLKLSLKNRITLCNFLLIQRNTGPAAVQLPDSFGVIMPFRYVEIERDADFPKSEETNRDVDFPKSAFNLKANDLTQIAYFSYFNDDASSFSSSDSILNQVWEMCKYSIKATSFAGLYIDGDRERIPYEADAYLNQLSHYSVDNEYAMARKTIEYFMEHPTWPTEWQLHVALLFYQDYMYTGNTELIEKYYEPLKYKTLMELEYEDGLISTHSPKLTGEFMAKLGFADTTQRVRDIVDWPPAQKDTGWKLPKDWPQGERDGFVFPTGKYCHQQFLLPKHENHGVVCTPSEQTG